MTHYQKQQQQKLNQLKAVFNSIVEAVENNYYSEFEGLQLGDINYTEIREWAGMEPENDDNLTKEQVREDRMIEDICYLVQQQLI